MKNRKIKYKTYLLVLTGVIAATGCFAAVLPSDTTLGNFTNAQGTVIQAELISCREGAVSLRRTDGVVFKNVPAVVFSEADREYIVSWAAAEQLMLRDEVVKDLVPSFLTHRKESPSPTGGMSDRVVRFEPDVILYNAGELEFEGEVEGTLIVVARVMPEGGGAHVVLLQQEFKAPLRGHGRSTRIRLEPFEWVQQTSLKGYKYEGYLIALKDSAGAVAVTRSTYPEWAEDLTATLKTLTAQGGTAQLNPERLQFTKWDLPR